MAQNRELQALVNIAGQLDPSLQRSVQQASKSLSGIKTAAKATGKVAAAGFAAVTAASVVAAKALLDLGSEFDAAKDTIRIGTGATGDALDALYSDMQEVYKSVPTSMEDASAAIADYNTRLGLTGEPLQELSKQALQVSDMLGEDLSATIEGSSKAFQQWNVSTEDMSEAMDYVFKVSQSTGSGFNDLMTDMQSYGAQLQEMGFGFNEATALIGQLDKAGVNTSEVLGAMKKSVSALAKEGLSASDGLQKYYDSIMNAKDATEATSIASEIFGTRAASTMAAAIRNGTLSADDLTASLEASGETINGAATDTYDFAEQFQLLKQNAQIALEPIATAVFDLVNQLFPYLQEAMDTLLPIFQEFATSLLPVLEDVGTTLLPIISEALQYVGEIVQMLLPYVVSAIKLVMSIIEKLLPVVMEIIDAIMPLVEVVLVTVFDLLEQLMPILMEVIDAVLPIITELIVALMPVITTLFEALSPIISLFAQLISKLLPPLVSILNTLMPIIKLAANIVSTHLTVAIQALTPVIEGVINHVAGIADVFAMVFEGLVGIVSKPINAIIGLVNTAIDAINQINVDVPDWVPVLGGTHFGFDIPNIPMFADGGFTSGPSIAGEAGTEAVISFNRSQRAENLSYWAKAGRMLGVDDNLMTSFERGASTSGDSISFTFAPQITINGTGDVKDDIIAALRREEDEFMDIIEEMLSRRGGERYAYN